MSSNMQSKEIKSEAVQTRGGRKTHHLLTFVVAMIIAWGLGTYAYCMSSDQMGH
jgi:hypothetical protein